jgi:hypothetical protein
LAETIAFYRSRDQKKSKSLRAGFYNIIVFPGFTPCPSIEQVVALSSTARDKPHAGIHVTSLRAFPFLLASKIHTKKRGRIYKQPSSSQQNGKT